MTKGMTVTKQVHFKHGNGSRKVLKEGEAPKPQPVGSIPRISRLMALAIHMQGMVDGGEVDDYAELAELAHVTRARITQIMDLLLLAPSIQEDILCLPPGNGGRDAIRERMVRPIAAVPDWRKQRRLWHAMEARGGEYAARPAS